MTRMSKTREHRARELLNLVTLAHRCANLPDVDEAERRRWRDVVRRSMEELREVWPGPAPWGDDVPSEWK